MDRNPALLLFTPKEAAQPEGQALGRVNATYAEIRQRVYRGLVDTPKTNHSYR